MSGPKAYTLREMKGIVDYLVEHNAYGELKGRKMWMDFSNSSLTTRTWQSLKETFLKRILPDIQNPYYRLTRDQVCSFRQGYDVAEREKKNRLEIRSSSEERSNNAKKQQNSEQPLVTQTACTSAKKPNEVDKTAGEDIQSEKILTRNRSSADTFILEDSNRQSNDNSTENLEADPNGTQKTMRNLLVFEESETPPVVQAVLEDFGTDSEEESPLKIVESPDKEIKYENIANDQTVPEDSENVECIEIDLTIEEAPTVDPEIITAVSSNDLVNWLTECAEEGIQTKHNDETNTEQETSKTTNISTEAVTSSVKGTELLVEDSEPIVIENTEESAKTLNKKSIENDSNYQNSLSSTNDTIIPNNQEVLNTEVNKKSNGMSDEASLEKVTTRKRSSSQELAKGMSRKASSEKDTTRKRSSSQELTNEMSNKASSEKVTTRKISSTQEQANEMTSKASSEKVTKRKISSTQEQANEMTNKASSEKVTTRKRSPSQELAIGMSNKASSEKVTTRKRSLSQEQANEMTNKASSEKVTKRKISSTQEQANEMTNKASSEKVTTRKISSTQEQANEMTSKASSEKDTKRKVSSTQEQVNEMSNKPSSKKVTTRKISSTQEQANEMSNKASSKKVTTRKRSRSQELAIGMSNKASSERATTRKRSPSQKLASEMSNKASSEKVPTRKRSSSQEQAQNKAKKLNYGPEKTNADFEATPPSSNNSEGLLGPLKNAETTIGNAQKTPETPIIEESHINPCLKSVSLFEEQFNTTKYLDSEDEDTPIAKNDVKQPEESIVNNKMSSKPHHNIESVNNNESNKPNQEVEIVEATMPTQNQEAFELHGNQSKIDLIPKDNACKAIVQEVGNKEVTILEADNETAHTKKSRKENVLVLSSISDSDEVVANNCEERRKRLSRAFGFVPGTSRTARRRKSIQNRRARLRTISRGHHERSDADASYTDIDESEVFVSPPHGRRNRRGRMYKKPETGKVVSLEEGRLFVILGNKAYPLVSDGKDLNYVNYDASDNEEELIWRQKYIDQKKKAAELQKQIERVKSEARSSRNQSPIRSSTTLRNGGGAVPASSVNHDDTAMNIVQNDSGKIQITLSNNNEEKINLEGHWPQVLPIMQQVMNMFYKPDNPTAVKENTKVDVKVPGAQQAEDISGCITPIIPVVSATRKVDELEREIFQEIAERGKLEDSVDTEKMETTSNVTKRKARAPSTSSEKSIKPAKITRKSKKSADVKPEAMQADDKPKIAGSKTQDKPKESSVPLTVSDASSERSISKDDLTTNPSKKIEAGDKKEMKDDEKRVVTDIKKDNEKRGDKDNKKDIEKRGDKDIKKGNEKIVEKEIKKDNEKGGDKYNKTSTKYKLPPVEPRVTRSRKSGNDTDTSTAQSPSKKGIATPKANSSEEDIRYMLPPGRKSRNTAAKLTLNKSRSPENPHEISQDRFGNSVDSTQGYQDSDASPMKNTKRKKKLSLVVKKGKHFRRKSFPSVSVDELSLDSSNSSYFVPRKSFSHPTLDSEIYKTDSYRILMGGRRFSITKLNAIEESSKTDYIEHCNSVSKASNDSLVIEIGTGSSSIVSLPVSPELSIVENLSISREMVQNISHPTINEHQANDSVVSNLYNQYLIADVDVSVPLMQQDCELLHTPNEKMVKKVKKPKVPAKSPIKVSDLINKVSSANITANSTVSDTLDQRLRDLLLESAKKITNKSEENLMEVDVPIETKKAGKKRCSTPRKRITKKSKATIGPVIDEHMEFCTKSGRQSCPPLSTFVPLDENANNSADVVLKPKKPARVKKDIIKVKIQRPSKAKVIDCNTSQASVYTDSGINESASINGIFRGNGSVDLIHNHSETCLQAHECIGDSIEFVENSISNVISLHSTESLQSELDAVMKDMEGIFEEQASPSLEFEAEEKCSEEFATPPNTVYHSPIDHTNSSLITDDLSEGNSSPPTKWYLLSDDETNTGHAHKPEEMTSNMRSSNYLKQIFPIACAVPDLSTISEISKENDSTRKTLGEDTTSSGGLN